MESAESGGGQEAVLRVFRVCGLTNDQDRASLNRVGELIYSFFCHVQGGSQHLEEACRRSASSLELLCADCYASRENSGPSRDMLKSEGSITYANAGCGNDSRQVCHINHNHMVLK